MECPYRVEVKHGDNVVGFEFNRMSDAVAFINSAVDTIDNNSEITLIKKEDQ